MEGRRSYAARAGLALLNLPVAGLGLLRLGNWKMAVAVFTLSTCGLWFLSNGPLVSFAVLALVAAGLLGLVVISIALTWSGSARATPIPIYSRWFSLLAIALAAYFGLFMIFPDPEQRNYRSFYLLSEAMAPTLPKLDRLIAFMKSPERLKRGDLVLIKRPDGVIYVKRVVGLAGDRVSLQSGRIFLNGSIVAQAPIGESGISGEPGRKLREKLPAEAGSHEILDLGPGLLDDFEGSVVAAGTIFVLGDNRDRSADSRVSPDEGGLGPVALKDVVGVPLYHSWGSSRPLGTTIH